MVVAALTTPRSMSMSSPRHSRQSVPTAWSFSLVRHGQMRRRCQGGVAWRCACRRGNGVTRCCPGLHARCALRLPMPHGGVPCGPRPEARLGPGAEEGLLTSLSRTSMEVEREERSGPPNNQLIAWHAHATSIYVHVGRESSGGNEEPTPGTCTVESYITPSGT